MCIRDRGLCGRAWGLCGQRGGASVGALGASVGCAEWPAGSMLRSLWAYSGPQWVVRQGPQWAARQDLGGQGPLRVHLEEVSNGSPCRRMWASTNLTES
eukprot:6829555-Pyramimonas_sp.AAC.1